MKAVKIVIGILLLLGALGNLRGVSDLRSPGEVSGYMGVTLAFFIIGAFLLYSGITSDSSSLRITDDDEEEK
jgi:hypothetical protein